MPHYQLMNDDPESLLVFLEENIIASGRLGNSDVASQPEFLTLRRSEMKGEIDGREAGVYYIEKGGEASKRKALKSYICDYEPNKVHRCVLGKTADFCFTVTMNGCTFGIGIPGADGTVMVSHANTGGQTDPQRQQTFDVHGSQQVSMLEPALYRHMAPRLTATTFGIRTAKGWKFYFQLYQPSSGTFKCFGTFPVPSQQMAA